MSDVSTVQASMQSKICNTCNEDLPLDKYHMSKNSRLGRHNTCKQCRSIAGKNINNPRKTEGDKLCSGLICKGKMKPVAEFHKSKGTSDGLQTACKPCQALQARIWSSTYDGFIIKLFGILKHNCLKRAKDLVMNITIDDIKTLFTKQEGKCALTGKELTYSQMEEDANNGDSQLQHRWNISVDRIDSSKGYEKHNIQLVGGIINRMKTDLTDQKFIDLCRCVAKYDDYLYENGYTDSIDPLVLDKTSKSYGFEVFIRHLFKDLIHNNKKRPKELEVNINIDDIILLYKKQGSLCALTGTPLTIKNTVDRKGEENDHCHIQNIWNISVDRIDSSKGYDKDNIQLLGAIINRMKLDLSEEDFIELCRLL
jgi:hypothetical protein